MTAQQWAYLMLISGTVLANSAVALTNTPARNVLAWLFGYAAWMLAFHHIAVDVSPTVTAPWELVATSFAYFGVLAFPTIVWRYFYRR